MHGRNKRRESVSFDSRFEYERSCFGDRELRSRDPNLHSEELIPRGIFDRIDVRGVNYAVYQLGIRDYYLRRGQIIDDRPQSVRRSVFVFDKCKFPTNLFKALLKCFKQVKPEAGYDRNRDSLAMFCIERFTLRERSEVRRVGKECRSWLR